MRKTYLKNNLGITVDWTYLSKIYFNICNGSITYLGTKTKSRFLCAGEMHFEKYLS